MRPHQLRIIGIDISAPARVRVERVDVRAAAEDLEPADERIPRAVAHDRGVHVREYIHLAHELAQKREHRVMCGLLRRQLRRAREPRVLRIPGRVELHDVGDVEVDEARAHTRCDRGVVRHPVPDGLYRDLRSGEDQSARLGAAIAR